ncbi:hypothetical protein VL20_3299 [Microcystis panniformis FACHB-1757]|uniref:Uncharacterized protein n=1 Tax=Microcystis panniformis FACHB-1757 TaxID=1638788 RepID=A0A0K1S2C7_9CHRO|nr:hypothetical protein VL20_3299 [Microcystis panniformis FACHB-1757]
MIKGDPPPIGTPLIKGAGGIKTPLIKGGRGDQNPPYQGGSPAYRHPPYQGGQGGSRTKSIFNLIETTYLNILDYTKVFRRGRAGLAPYPISTNNFNQKIAKALTNFQICSIILL